METLDAATIRNMAAVTASKAMLAAMATLCILFIQSYMAVLVGFYILIIAPIPTCACARKRIVNRVIHHRKFAVVAINPNSRAGLFGNL